MAEPQLYSQKTLNCLYSRAGVTFNVSFKPYIYLLLSGSFDKLRTKGVFLWIKIAQKEMYCF